jgi:hypothetical protein
MAICTGYILRWLRWRGAPASVETILVLAVAYLSFYVTNAPAKACLCHIVRAGTQAAGGAACTCECATADELHPPTRTHPTPPHTPQGSGVIAVVVFGLWGNAHSVWGMLASAEESGAFGAVWDAITCGANALVFFWSGVSSLNYFVRSALRSAAPPRLASSPPRHSC